MSIITRFPVLSLLSRTTSFVSEFDAGNGVEDPFFVSGDEAVGPLKQRHQQPVEQKHRGVILREERGLKYAGREKITHHQCYLLENVTTTLIGPLTFQGVTNEAMTKRSVMILSGKMAARIPGAMLVTSSQPQKLTQNFIHKLI